MKLTPEQEIIRDAWLAELWRPVPEWRPSKDERLDALVRNARLDESRGEPELPLDGVA